MTNTNTMEVKANTHSKKSTLFPMEKWLDNVCPVIKQNDFDTCRMDYSDGKYDNRNGYNQAYNTYLWEFENC